MPRNRFSASPFHFKPFRPISYHTYIPTWNLQTEPERSHLGGGVVLSCYTIGLTDLIRKRAPELAERTRLPSRNTVPSLLSLSCESKAVGIGCLRKRIPCEKINYRNCSWCIIHKLDRILLSPGRCVM